MVTFSISYDIIVVVVDGMVLVLAFLAVAWKLLFLMLGTCWMVFVACVGTRITWVLVMLLVLWLTRLLRTRLLEWLVFLVRGSHVIDGKQVRHRLVVVGGLLLADIILPLVLVLSNVSSVLVWYSFSIISSVVPSVISVFSRLLDFCKLTIFFYILILARRLAILINCIATAISTLTTASALLNVILVGTWSLLFHLLRRSETLILIINLDVRIFKILFLLV